MITAWDEYALHQTAAPVAHPASDDPAVYERYFFCFFDLDGGGAAGLTVHLHPNLGRIDAAVHVTTAGRTDVVLVSDDWDGDRARLTCGPVGVGFEQPMQRVSVRCIDDVVRFDLEFRAEGPALEEDRVTRRRGDVVVQDRSRYAQLGRAEGSVAGRPLARGDWRCGRDHSWGIWDAPWRRPEHTTRASAPSFFWLIGALPGSDDGESLLAVTHEIDGVAYGEYGAIRPCRPGSAQRVVGSVAIDPAYGPGSSRLDAADVVLDDRKIHVENVIALSPRAFGYDRPDWVPGAAHDRLSAVLRDGWNHADLDRNDSADRRAVQCVRLRDADGHIGYGVIDQLGPAVPPDRPEDSR